MSSFRRIEMVRTTVQSFCVSLLVFTIAVISSPANAAWAASVTATSGPMGMQRASATFTPIKADSLNGTAAGTGGATFDSVTVNTGTTFYVDITNTSPVPMNIYGTVTITMGGGLYINPGVAVNTCVNNWNTTFNTCSPSSVQVLSQTTTSPTPSFLYGQVAAGGVIHVQITTGAGIGNISIDTAITLTYTRSGIDRTAS